MRHPGSGPQHTLNPQPSLTDGRGEREGGGGWGLHTNHSQINSLLPQSNILPPFSLPHLSPFFLLPAHSLTPPSFPSLLPLILHLPQPLSLLHSILASFSITSARCMAFPGSSLFLQPGDPVRGKMIPGGTMGSGRQAVPLVKVPDLG